MIDFSNFVQHLRKGLDDLTAEQMNLLANEHAPDYETYSRVFGTVQGLKAARGKLDELVRQINSGVL